MGRATLERPLLEVRRDVTLSKLYNNKQIMKIIIRDIRTKDIKMSVYNTVKKTVNN